MAFLGEIYSKPALAAPSSPFRPFGCPPPTAPVGTYGGFEGRAPFSRTSFSMHDSPSYCYVAILVQRKAASLAALYFFLCALHFKAPTGLSLKSRNYGYDF